jgi:transcriptional antiterminator
MLNKLEQNIVFHVYQHRGTINSQSLASLCGVSKSTIRKEIILLNVKAQELGFHIEAKQSAGYRIIIAQDDKAEQFFTKLKSDIREDTYCNNSKVVKYY